MKKKLLLINIMISILVLLQGYDLTPEQWKEDFETFKETAFEEYHLFNLISDLDMFEEIYNQTIENIENLTYREIIINMMKMTDFVNEGHLGIILEFEEHYKLPIEIKHFNGDYHIVRTTNEYKDYLGSKIIGINGIDINKIKKEMSKYFANANDYNEIILFERYLVDFSLMEFIGIYDENVVFNLLKDSKTINKSFNLVLEEEDLELESELEAPENLSLPYTYHYYHERHIHYPYWYEYDNNNIIYFKYDRTRSSDLIGREDDKKLPPFEELWDEVIELTRKKDIEIFILDIRHNPGGFRQVAEDMVSKIKSICFNINIYIITGNQSHSATSIILGGLINQENIILIGDPTAVSSLTFGGGRMHLPHSNIRIGYGSRSYDNNPHHLISFYPQIPISETFEYFNKGKDEVIEYITKYNKYKNKYDNDNYYSIPILNNYEKRYFDLFSNYLLIPLYNKTLIYNLQTKQTETILDFKYTNTYKFQDIIIISDEKDSLYIMNKDGIIINSFNKPHTNILAADNNNIIYVNNGNVYIRNNKTNKVDTIKSNVSFPNNLNTIKNNLYVLNTNDNRIILLNEKDIINEFTYNKKMLSLKTYNEYIYILTPTSLEIYDKKFNKENTIDIHNIQNFYINSNGLYIVKAFELYKYKNNELINQNMIFNPFVDKINEYYMIINDVSQLKVFEQKQEIEKETNQILTIHNTKNYEIHEGFFGDLKIYDSNNNIVFEKETENIPIKEAYEKDGKLIIRSLRATKIIDKITYDEILIDGYISLNILYSNGYIYYQDRNRDIVRLNIYDNTINKYYEIIGELKTLIIIKKSEDKEKLYLVFNKARGSFETSNKMKVINKRTREIEQEVGIRKAPLKDIKITNEKIILIYFDNVEFIYDNDFNLLNVGF